MYDAIIDANINRVSEGLRVIEDYLRFGAQDKALTLQIAKLRKSLNKTETRFAAHLQIRDTQKDQRAKEKPQKRKNLQDLLKANFKRVEEGLRVLEEYTGQATYNTMRYDVYELEKEVVLKALKPHIKPGIYLISHDLKILEQGLKWGLALVQLRDKNATKAQIYKKAKILKSLAKKYQTPFIINDYLDIAQLVDADGLHTGQDDLPIQDLRQLLGPQKLIGRTTHNMAQGQKAQKEGADYVSIGPIWETPSKPNRKGIGLGYLKKAKTELKIPYVAIGGIDLDRAKEVMKEKPPLLGLIRDYQSIPTLKIFF